MIEELLAAALGRMSEPGRTGSRRIVAAGGKRIRPELLLRCAALGGGAAGVSADPTDPAWTATLGAATAVELLHSATLLHDDLIDGSAVRRGVPAVHRAEGIPTAIIAGDALIAQSWRAIARCGPADVEDLADALADMCSGQELEAALAFDPAARPLDVLRVAQLKTGSLFRAACRIGARRGGLADAQVVALGLFGSDFGIALQLVDDLLDVTSEPAVLGKPCGADFRAGTMTMPTIFALADDARSAELLGLFRPGLDDADADRARALVLASGSAGRTAALARSFARRAGRAMTTVAAAAPVAGSAPAVALAHALGEEPMNYVIGQLRKSVTELDPAGTWAESDDLALLSTPDAPGSVAG
ncbi:MAG: polyprenyl synthetase family protein [Nakamurella sp.]